MNEAVQLTSVLLCLIFWARAEKLWNCWNYVRLINAGRTGSVHWTPNSVAHHHSVVCLTADVQQHFVLFLQNNFFSNLCFRHICMLFPRFSPFSSCRIRQNETWYGPSWRYCLLFHNWSSKYRVSNKLETVKLFRKSKIRKAIFFCYS